MTAPLTIVLVEPAGPLNVGSVARVMKNFGLAQLVLVNPQCDRLGREALQMAIHARDILDGAIEVPDLPTALARCDRVGATFGRDWDSPVVVQEPAAALPWLRAGRSPALVFGREDRGLSNDELKYAQRLIRIPTSEAYPSMNLAQAVAVCAYEWIREPIAPNLNAPDLNAPDLNAPNLNAPPVAEPIELAPVAQVEHFHRDLEALLLRSGFLYPHTVGSRMEKLRRILQRSNPSPQDLALLWGAVKQMNWAIDHLPRPDERQ